MSVPTNIYSLLLDLTRQALNDLANPTIPLSIIIRTATRIARLRNDHVSVWWLELEMIDGEDNQARQRVTDEMASIIDPQRFRLIQARIIEDYISARRVPRDPTNRRREPEVLNMSVHQIERLSVQLQLERDQLRSRLASTPAYGSNLNSALLAAELHLFNHQELLDRVRQRLHSYLSSIEQQLVFAQINANIFSRYQSYVDTRLAAIAPQILEQLNLAYEQTNRGSVEAYSHAALSCRRALKSLADLVYPPRSEPVIGADGKERNLTDDKYIARLWQFLSEQLGDSNTGKVMTHTLEALGNRIDAVYALASKGVHADIPVAELDQCVIQTYLLISDVLRVHEQVGS